MVIGKQGRFAKWIDLWLLLKVKHKQTDREWRLLRLVSELCHAAKCVADGEYYGKLGYQEELRKALADSFAQVIMMALNEGFDLEELEKLGQEELLHAIEKRLPK